LKALIDGVEETDESGDEDREAGFLWLAETAWMWRESLRRRER
jgi:hypothetical protein